MSDKKRALSQLSDPNPEGMWATCICRLEQEHNQRDDALAPSTLRSSSSTRRITLSPSRWHSILSPSILMSMQKGRPPKLGKILSTSYMKFFASIGEKLVKT